jgi:hypothetical protein
VDGFGRALARESLRGLRSGLFKSGLNPTTAICRQRRHRWPHTAEVGVCLNAGCALCAAVIAIAQSHKT